jgi:uncharacterized delta-60 repeat protein
VYLCHRCNVVGRAYSTFLSVACIVLSTIGFLGAPGAGRTLDSAGGALDPSFGARGLARIAGIRSCLPGEGGCSMSVGLVIQPNGAVLVAAGTLDPDCGSRFALARLRGGKLDGRFGRGGRILTQFGSSSAVAVAMGATPDGGIVLAGEVKGRESGDCLNPGAHIHMGGAAGFALARYLGDGTLNKTFGGDGTVLTNFDNASAGDVLVQPDGKVVIVGSSANRLLLARYDRRGRLDPSFGDDGRVLSDSGGSFWPVKAALDGVGRILVTDSPGCTPCPASVFRFTRDGGLDPTFGSDGRALVPTRSAQLRSVAVAGGQIVAAGMEMASRRRLIVARLSSDGTLDSSFGRGGLASLHVPRITFVNDVAIQRNGRIVVLTTRIAFKPSRDPVDFTLRRLLPNGSIDRTFGKGGTATANFGFSDVGEALAIQPDGRLVVAGVIGDRRGPFRADALGVARYLP